MGRADRDFPTVYPPDEATLGSLLDCLDETSETRSTVEELLLEGCSSLSALADDRADLLVTGSV